MKQRLKMKAGLLALLLPLGFGVNAATWKVSNQESNVSYVSIKQGQIAEVNHFTQVDGQLTELGAFTLTIPLSSVSTGVPIRDTRMKSVFFEVDRYPNLTLNAQIDPKVLQDINVGEVSNVEVAADINLHGESKSMLFQVTVAKLSTTSLLVTSTQPVIINAGQFKLIKGIKKLRDLVGLSEISYAVPVSFVLSLHQ
ncbi:YceI family protein [Shewanella surugensis]|uniref:YceI family protein n=1 Tax=Shewanella surugensis TaxID=212020 RepID=A0ABT0LEP8_9GAMM|nr:YceI family protein [Shewanella surugensis]MCL1126173.1 YceI family protein [Shewanella surugensis]